MYVITYIYTRTYMLLFNVGDYELVVQSRCQDANQPCVPCEEEHPSCVGKPDGAHAISKRREYFMQCTDERTTSVKPCPVQAPYFDPMVGRCSVILDPCKYLTHSYIFSGPAYFFLLSLWNIKM